MSKGSTQGHKTCEPMALGMCGRASGWDPNQKDNLKNPSMTATSLIRVGLLLSYPTKRLKVHSLQKVHRFLDCRGPGILKREEIHESLEKHIESPQPSCSAPREKLTMGHCVLRSKKCRAASHCLLPNLHHSSLFATMEALCSQDSLMALYPAMALYPSLKVN